MSEQITKLIQELQADRNRPVTCGELLDVLTLLIAIGQDNTNSVRQLAQQVITGMNQLSTNQQAALQNLAHQAKCYVDGQLGQVVQQVKGYVDGHVGRLEQSVVELKQESPSWN